MSPLTALMPTHAAITEHLTTAPGARPCESVSVRDLSSGCAAIAPSVSVHVHQAEPAPICMHKYVILMQGGGVFPIVFSRDIQHSHMVPKGYIPVSAGFVIVCGDHLRIPEVGSSTLGLDPRPQDESLLRSFFSRSAPLPSIPCTPAQAIASEQAQVTAVNSVTTVSPTHFSCFRCGDAATFLYCLNCASDLLAAEAKHQCSSMPSVNRVNPVNSPVRA